MLRDAECAKLEGTISNLRLLTIFGLFLSPLWCASNVEDIEVKADEFLKVFARDAKVEKIFGGLGRTDGPIFSRLGFLLFCDTSARSILKYAPGSATAPVAYRENGGGARGLTFDRQGRLIACGGWQGGSLGRRKMVPWWSWRSIFKARDSTALETSCMRSMQAPISLIRPREMPRVPLLTPVCRLLSTRSLHEESCGFSRHRLLFPRE